MLKVSRVGKQYELQNVSDGVSSIYVRVYLRYYFYSKLRRWQQFFRQRSNDCADGIFDGSKDDKKRQKCSHVDGLFQKYNFLQFKNEPADDRVNREHFQRRQNPFNIFFPLQNRGWKRLAKIDSRYAGEVRRCDGSKNDFSLFDAYAKAPQVHCKSNSSNKRAKYLTNFYSNQGRK